MELNEILDEYTKSAAEMLEKTGKPFDENDIAKVAEFMIDHDQQIDKVSEYQDLGAIMARSFINELNKTAGLKGVSLKQLIEKGILSTKGKVEPLIEKSKNILFDVKFKGKGLGRSAKHRAMGAIKPPIRKVDTSVKSKPYSVAAGAAAAGGAGGFLLGRKSKD